MDYANALSSVYTRLSHALDADALLHEFVHSAAGLSHCELTQVFLLDASGQHLDLVAEVLDGAVRARAGQSPRIDKHAETLLQFSLARSRPVCLRQIDATLYETSFLPVQHEPWISLLCVPLIDRDQTARGALVCASKQERSLEGLAPSLGALGAFVLSQHFALTRSRSTGVSVSLGPAKPVEALGYGLIGTSAAMRKTCHLVDRVLHSPYTVLLTGETGTGKEVIARAIHDYGPRRKKAFVVQNCAAFPESLLESELFGYRKGAFTGADRDRPGLFEVAHEGTLLLDEIGDMPIGLQSKLLRVLQEGEIRPLGSNTVRKVDVRIIAATHRDLQALIAEGRFREDLYYRLAQFPIALPPLRERAEDIEALARHFADMACDVLQRQRVGWSNRALAALSGYAFPGNVRELKGFVERAVLLCDDTELLAEHFSVGQEAGPFGQDLKFREQMARFERGLLLECLRKSKGNRSLTARKLGLSRRTLLYRMAHLDIDATEIGPC